MRGKPRLAEGNFTLYKLLYHSILLAISKVTPSKKTRLIKPYVLISLVCILKYKPSAQLHGVHIPFPV